MLVDTSIAIAALVLDHPDHEVARSVLDRSVALAGHAEFETYSVLTRLPPPRRRSPATVVELVKTTFAVTRHLSPDGAATLLRLFAQGGIAGGSVYDGLVGAVAAEQALPLATLDRRALDTYRALGVEVEFLG